MHSTTAHNCARSCFAKAKNTTSRILYQASLRTFSSGVSTSLTKRQLKQYCDILGVPLNASEPKIKQAFYKKSLLLHPDRNTGADSQRAFTEVSEAYQAMITYKRNESSDGFTQQTWRRTSEMGGFRPWMKVPEKERAQSAPFTTSSVELDEHIVEHHPIAGTAQNIEGNAGEYCSDFYIEQLEKDFENYHREKLKQQAVVKETTDACVVM